MSLFQELSLVPKITSKSIVENRVGVPRGVTLKTEIDAKTVAEFLNEHYTLGDTQMIHSPEEIAKLQSYNKIELGLFYRDELIGYIISFVFNIYMYQIKTNTTHINCLCVHQDWRNQNLASYLIQETIARGSKDQIFTGYFLSDKPRNYKSTPVVSWIYPLNEEKLSVSFPKFKFQNNLFPTDLEIEWRNELVINPQGNLRISPSHLKESLLQTEAACLRGTPKVQLFWRVLTVKLDANTTGTVMRITGIFLHRTCTPREKLHIVYNFLHKHKEEHLFATFEQINNIDYWLMSSLKAIQTENRYFNVYNYSQGFTPEEIQVLVY